MLSSMRHAMSTRGGDVDASRTRQRSSPQESYSPSLTDAETVGDDDHKYRETDENEAFKREMRETFFGHGRIEELETRNASQKTRLDTLTKRVAEMKIEWIKEYQRAEAEKYRADKAEAALKLADPRELLATQQSLSLVIEEKNDALSSQEQMRKDMNEAKLKADDIRATLEAHCLKLATDLEEAKIDQLLDKVETLAAENFAITESMNKLRNDNSRDIGDLTFYKSQNENLKYDSEELRSKLTRGEREITKIQLDNARLLAQSTGGQAVQQNNNHQDDRHSAEDPRLKHDISAFENKLSILRSSMAYYVTQLDINFKGWRLFDCQHVNFRDIPDGQNSTREVESTHELLLGLLQDWLDDDEFIKEYNGCRRSILQHHRAHERAAQGRGVANFRIKSEFVKLDEKRGIQIKY